MSYKKLTTLKYKKKGGEAVIAICKALIYNKSMLFDK
jgi:hypothetical protein